jgi:hypothetical protein
MEKIKRFYSKDFKQFVNSESVVSGGIMQSQSGLENILVFNCKHSESIAFQYENSCEALKAWKTSLTNSLTRNH